MPRIPEPTATILQGDDQQTAKNSYTFLRDYLHYDLAHEKYVRRNMNCRMMADEIIGGLKNKTLHISRYSNNPQYFDNNGKFRNGYQLKESLSRAIYRLVHETYQLPKQTHPKRRCFEGKYSLRETIRKKQLSDESWSVLSKGWPDFLKYKKVNGTLIIRAEELKHDEQAKLNNLGLTKDQKRICVILSKLIPIDIVHIDKDGNTQTTIIDRTDLSKKREKGLSTPENVIKKLRHENKVLRTLLFLIRINNADLSGIKDANIEPSKEDVQFYKRLGELAFNSRHGNRKDD